MIFADQDRYRQWRSDYFLKTNNFSHWLSPKAMDELYFIQDYLINLDKTLESIPDENYQQVGKILKADFTDMANQLEKSVVSYFEKGWSDLQVGSKKRPTTPNNSMRLKRYKTYNLWLRHVDISNYFYKKNTNSPRTDIKPVTYLYDIAPNGMKINMVKIKEVANLDNSGVEYELFYKENEFEKRDVRFGTCDLITGCIRFDQTDDDAKYLGVNYEALALLTAWIRENMEPDGNFIS